MARPVLPGHFFPVFPDDGTDSGKTKPDENPNFFTSCYFSVSPRRARSYKAASCPMENPAGAAAFTARFCHSLCRDVCFHFSTKTELYKAAMITQLLHPKISCMSTPQRNGGLESGCGWVLTAIVPPWSSNNIYYGFNL